MKSKSKTIAAIVLIAACSLFGGYHYYQANHPPVNVTVNIDKPAAFVPQDITARADPVLPPQTAQEPPEQAKVFAVVNVPSPIETPPTIKPAAPNPVNDIESSYYVFTPIQGIVYAKIYFKVPQQSLEYIRFK